MKTSQQGIDFIKSFEKYRAMPYKDVGNKSTVGYGHLILPTDPDYSNGLSPDQADELFKSDLAHKAEQPVMDAIQIDVSEQEFDAMASLCFNIGSGNFHDSHLVKLLNAGETAERVSLEFARWCHVNGIVSDGLLARRNAEADIFLKGIYVNHN